MSSKGNVAAPSTAKNAISVGASMNLHSTFEESMYYEDFKNVIQKSGFKFSTTEECCAYNGKDNDLGMFVFEGIIRISLLTIFGK